MWRKFLKTSMKAFIFIGSSFFTEGIFTILMQFVCLRIISFQTTDLCSLCAWLWTWCKQQFSIAKFLQQFHNCKSASHPGPGDGCVEHRTPVSIVTRWPVSSTTRLAPNFPFIIANLFSGLSSTGYRTKPSS